MAIKWLNGHGQLLSWKSCRFISMLALSFIHLRPSWLSTLSYIHPCEFFFKTVGLSAVSFKNLFSFVVEIWLKIKHVGTNWPFCRKRKMCVWEHLDHCYYLENDTCQWCPWNIGSVKILPSLILYFQCNRGFTCHICVPQLSLWSFK